MTDPDPIDELQPAARENIELLAEYQEREEAQVSRLQFVIEAVSEFFGSPAYFAFVIVFIALWVLVNLWGRHAGWQHVDEPPFFWLQGIVSSNALLLTVAVLIRQNRMAKLAARAHLDLHVNLLAEKKVSKVLEVVDELRKALGHLHPDDSGTQELATAADPQAILSAIERAESPPAAGR
ncbi:MAG: DUF1003 domain-containing protein [Pseudomonadota bacterium]|nr:DUF1003 domain-containing protein [Pseudomonadota bacterium]